MARGFARRRCRPSVCALGRRGATCRRPRRDVTRRLGWVQKPKISRYTCARTQKVSTTVPAVPLAELLRLLRNYAPQVAFTRAITVQYTSTLVRITSTVSCLSCKEPELLPTVPITVYAFTVVLCKQCAISLSTCPHCQARPPCTTWYRTKVHSTVVDWRKVYSSRKPDGTESSTRGGSCLPSPSHYSTGLASRRQVTSCETI